MLDLSSTLFLKGKFQITSEQDTDLLWALVYKIRGWMLPKWRRSGEQLPEDLKVWSRWKMGGSFSSENGIVYLRSRHFEENELHFWACQITESWPSRNGCAPREWTTEIGFCQHTVSSVEVSIVIYYSDRPNTADPSDVYRHRRIPASDVLGAEVPAVDQAFSRASNLRMARGEGTMTRRDNSLMRQYRDVYDGREIDIESHIKTSQSQPNSPKFLRVLL